MSLRLAILFSVLLAFSATIAVAQQRPFDSMMSSYQYIAKHCGADPTKPSFDQSSYVKALSDAARARRKAKSRAEREGIDNLVKDLKKCQKEEAWKLTIGPINNCDDLVEEYTSFLHRMFQLPLTAPEDYIDRDTTTFREPLKACINKTLSSCIDPTDTAAVDRVRSLAFIAGNQNLEMIHPVGDSQFDQITTKLNPNRVQLRFCTETDYACKGDPKKCDARIKDVKDILQEYFEK